MLDLFTGNSVAMLHEHWYGDFFFMLSLPSLGSHIKLACYNELESTSFLFSERSYIDLVSLIADVFDKMIALDGF